MDFAKKQLEKYGWCDGKGLGKNEDGLLQPIKPKLKRSAAGIGYDAAAEFTEHWWSQLYDEAAKNVEVEEQHGKTKKIKTKKDEEFVITNSTWRIKANPKNKESGEQYTDYFIKKAILAKGGVKLESLSDTKEEEEIVKKDVLKMTDEELFAACAGRTAHKGARHGLKATGKLARIAQQEQMLLSQPRFNGYSHFKHPKEKVSDKDLQVVEDINLNNDTDVVITQKKKKKKKRCSSLNNNCQINVEQTEFMSPLLDADKKDSGCTNIYESKGKRKKKLEHPGSKIKPSDSPVKRSNETNLIEMMNVDDDQIETKHYIKIKKCKKKRK